MMEPAENRSDSDQAVAGLRLRSGCSQVEAAVRAIIVVVVDKLGQDPAEVTLADWNHVVEAFPADCPYPPFRNRVRAGRQDWRPQTLDAQPGGAPAEVGAPDPVAIVDQISRFAVPGCGFDQLPPDPGSSLDGQSPPRMRSVPHNGLAFAMVAIRSRISGLNRGLPRCRPEH